MLHSLMAEFLGTALMILFCVAYTVMKSLPKQNTMEADTFLPSPPGLLVFLLPCLSLVVSALTLPWHYVRQFLA